MNRRTIIISAALFAVAALVLSLFSCGKEEPEPAPAYDWSEFVVVVQPEGIRYLPGLAENYVEKVRLEIEKLSGIKPELASPYSDPAPHEIVIGWLDRGAAADYMESMRTMDWLIAYHGGSFYVIAHSYMIQTAYTALARFIKMIPDIDDEPEEGILVDGRKNYRSNGNVILGGLDVTEYYLVDNVDPIYSGNRPSHEFKREYAEQYGYQMKKAQSVLLWSDYKDRINYSSGWLIFGYCEDFMEGAPEPEPGQAVIAFDGKNYMIYSGDENDSRIYEYMFRLFDTCPEVDGRVIVDVPEGFTVIE